MLARVQGRNLTPCFPLLDAQRLVKKPKREEEEMSAEMLRFTVDGWGGEKNASGAFFGCGMDRRGN